MTPTMSDAEIHAVKGLAALDRCFEGLWKSKAFLFPGNPKTAAHALYLEGAAEGARSVQNAPVPEPGIAYHMVRIPLPPCAECERRKQQENTNAATT